MGLWQALAGLGLFLFGMKQLETALKLLAGPHFNRWIVTSTNQPLRSVSTGILATAMVQSSSLVGLITLAFVGAGIMPLVNGIGVVIGSNLGTTFTGWLVATLGFKVDMGVMVYPLLGLGGLGYGLLKNKSQAVALAVLGLALLLLGLGLMKDSASVLSGQLSLGALQGYPLIVYLLFGLVITAIIQSSSVMMMLALSALYADLLTLPAAAALVIGADLGTTSTVMLGGIQGATAKRRLALAHVIFNLVVDVLAFVSIHWILMVIAYLQISDPLLGLVAFHSFFNLTGLLLFIPFIGTFSDWLEQVVKTKTHPHSVAYIDAVPASVTDAAMQALALEVNRLIALVLFFNMRLLGIKNNTITTEDLPVDFRQHSTLEFYTHLKGLEGEIISYAMAVQRMSQPETSKANKNYVLGHQIDHYMQAIRAAIYAAKSVKDIHENILEFDQSTEKSIQQLYATIMKSTVRDYQFLIKMMAADCEILPDELDELKVHANNARREIRAFIHQQMIHLKVDATKLSTLLNVNKETYNSKSALIKALRAIGSQQHKR
ncbi:Na/Pi symporter [Marinicella sp. S1101]|nr:Na/Pi symporter [Marinicella marina]